MALASSTGAGQEGAATTVGTDEGAGIGINAGFAAGADKGTGRKGKFCVHCFGNAMASNVSTIDPMIICELQPKPLRLARWPGAVWGDFPALTGGAMGSVGKAMLLRSG